MEQLHFLAGKYCLLKLFNALHELIFSIYLIIFAENYYEKYIFD